MTEKAIKFISEIVKPWESLNKELGEPFSMNPKINDFITRANSLAVNIKHNPESVAGLKPIELITESIDYKIISDLADSIKHGKLKKGERQCYLTASSMFERNSDAKLRFLRTRIAIIHNTYGKIDFMECSMKSCLFVEQKICVNSDWTPKIFNNSGDFSNEIKVHASQSNQIAWTGMALEIVQINENGEYENVDLNGEVKFTLTSEF